MGAKVVDRLSADLRREFPEMKGFSRANLLYMRALAESWPDASIVFLGGQAFLIVVVGYISKGAVVRGQGADSCEQVGDGGKIREELKRIVPEYKPDKR